jgi:hypothetical protein
MIEPGGTGWNFGINSDRRRMLSLNAGLSYTRGARESGDEMSVNGSAILRPSSALSVQIQPRYASQVDAAQYVTSTSAVPWAATYGRRYIFGEIDRKTVTLETRVEYTFSPTLTFQLYAQGLVSSGDYRRYKQLAAPSTFDFHVFQEGSAVEAGGGVTCRGGSICEDAQGRQHVDVDDDATPDFSFADGDFNVRSLIGNAVLRWEYRPGSTLFLVWQRQQRADAGLGDFEFSRDVGSLWGVPADDRLIVKVNYWFGM